MQKVLSQAKPARAIRAQKPKVGVILLNWNGWEDTFACLDSLRNNEYPATKVMVIDNASDETPAKDPRLSYPDVDFIDLMENTGFAKGNNVGIRQALEQGLDYVLLLNNDTEVAPDFLDMLVAAAESDPAVGMVGPMIYYHGEPEVIWSAGGMVDGLRGDTHMVGVDEIDRGRFGQEPRPVDWVTGCALLVKRDVVEEIGMLDERFFAYYEEAEWCARARRAGYQILHEPRAKVWHKISRQSREASPIVNYYMARNRLLYLRLTRSGLIPWAYTLIFDYGRRLASWTLRPKWRHKKPQRNALLQAIGDYARNRFGKAELQKGTRKA